MKKAFILVLLAAAGVVLPSHAVVISWASESLPSDIASASLVYVSGDASTQATIATASGNAIDGSILYEQTSTDSATRSSGYYYVMLTGTYGTQYVSNEHLSYDDARISTSELDPPSGTFLPSSFMIVPEPCTAMLLCVGAAAVALRRKHRG
jgi:hypothetical protein